MSHSMLTDSQLRVAIMNVKTMPLEKLYRLITVLGELQKNKNTGPLEDKLLDAVRCELFDRME